MNDTELDLDAIEARVAKVTRGQWTHDWQDDHRLPHGGTYVVRDEVGAELADTGPYKRGWDDAEFIAHARSDVPALVAELRVKRAECDSLRKTQTRIEALCNEDWHRAMPGYLLINQVRAALAGTGGEKP